MRFEIFLRCENNDTFFRELLKNCINFGLRNAVNSKFKLNYLKRYELYNKPAYLLQLNIIV